MAVIYTEENGQYTLDCTLAMWSTDQVHTYYQDSSHTYGNLSLLCDVDFVIENESHILLVEYKKWHRNRSDAREYSHPHWAPGYGLLRPRKYRYIEH